MGGVASKSSATATDGSIDENRDLDGATSIVAKEDLLDGDNPTVLPLEIWKCIILLSLPAKALVHLASTSRFFRKNLRDEWEQKRAFTYHLHSVLRLDAPLFPIPAEAGATEESNEAKTKTLPPSQEVDVLCNTDVLAAYQAYVEHFIVMDRRCRETNFQKWPTDDMQELTALLARLKELKTALPRMLIKEPNAPRVLQKAAKLLNAYASIADIANNNNFDWNKLDRLAVEGLGGAQHDAGEHVQDLYFCGDSMNDECSKASYFWADDLNSKLGREIYLVIYAGRSSWSRQAEVADPNIGAYSGLTAVAYNSISLIEVLMRRLDPSLRDEVKADENVPALTPS